MGKEIAFKNGRIFDFQGLVTLTLDRVILHTIMHHSSTSTYTPNFAEIEETFCGRTDIRTDVRTGGQTFETHFIRSTHYIKTEAPLCTTYRHSDLSNFVQRPAGSFFRCVPLPCCRDAGSGERERNSECQGSWCRQAVAPCTEHRPRTLQPPAAAAAISCQSTQSRDDLLYIQCTPVVRYSNTTSRGSNVNAKPECRRFNLRTSYYTRWKVL